MLSRNTRYFYIYFENNVVMKVAMKMDLAMKTLFGILYIIALYRKLSLYAVFNSL